jgi:hypothetical protein
MPPSLLSFSLSSVVLHVLFPVSFVVVVIVRSTHSQPQAGVFPLFLVARTFPRRLRPLPPIGDPRRRPLPHAVFTVVRSTRGPPYEQLLAAVGTGAGSVRRWRCRCCCGCRSCCCGPPLPHSHCRSRFVGVLSFDPCRPRCHRSRFVGVLSFDPCRPRSCCSCCPVVVLPSLSLSHPRRCPTLVVLSLILVPVAAVRFLVGVLLR